MSRRKRNPLTEPCEVPESLPIAEPLPVAAGEAAETGTTVKRRGHPPGPSERLPIAERVDIPSRCPRCGATERSGYSNTRRLDLAGVHQGRPFSQVVWRHCRCLQCGQSRIDKSFE